MRKTYVRECRREYTNLDLKRSNTAMSQTLARRIRRIGLLPTTFKETKETRLVKNAEGEEEEACIIKRKPVRHYQRLTAAERAAKALQITREWRAAHNDGRASRVQAAEGR